MMAALAASLLGILLAPAADRAKEAPQHPVIQPMAGSVSRGAPKLERHGTLKLYYKDGTETVNKEVSGQTWHLEYSIPPTGGVAVGPAEILANYEAEARRHGAKILHKASIRRLTFGLPRKDGGITYCLVYGAYGSYILDIVDEAPLETTLVFGAEQMRAALDKDGRVSVYGILFDTDKATLKPGSGAAIEEVAKLLQGTAELRLEVQGHTDATGAAAHNRDLSARRAATVVAALGLYGIEGARLTAKGYGPDQPVASNDTEEGKATNRRVDLVKAK